MTHTVPRRNAQAPKRRSLPDPHAPDALSVTDGHVTIGSIVFHDGKHHAFDAVDQLIGAFRSRQEAMRAVASRSVAE